ncbi:hybrid sensor histidine kinase/response regulator [Chitinophaga barathri]|uniref:histidine kinase n=1 Tax=Chitinophaga barathri TaxID=1647451 RepID=A0A3N4MAV0_9BACT|nr:hybrid sensor histidine kinase/response regulator [Chitinophaga barathri]RPD38537.1 hybrid sensor histidine kinase/response regulator [Chitinophaga barathri]
MKDTRKRILMVDDDEDDFFLVNTLLQDVTSNQYTIDWAATYDKAIEAIEKKEHELYLVDYRLGRYTGLDILRHFQKIGYEAPVIMLTGKGDYAIDNEAMMAGASDYLVKGEITGPELERAIRYGIMEFKHLRTIAENERKYFGIFEKSHDLIVLADCNKNIIEVNPTVLRKMQYSRDEFLKMNLKDLFVHEAEALQFLLDICEDDAIIQKEFSFKNKSGQKIEVLVNANKLDEQLGTFLCVAEDITEKKREELEKRQQEKFVISGRIARVIAHEVRNPLTNILLAVGQFNQDGTPDSEDHQLYLDIIERNCTRINQLVTELLQSTRMMELHLQDWHVNTLLKNALALAYDRLQLNNIRLKEFYTEENVTLQADDEKMNIALLNILINAVEAMIPGEGILTVSTQSENGKAYIRIRDNGMGIPEDNKARLFDPFFTSKTKGTGLGLTSTQNIIINHKGTIHVESAPGEGTLFTIILPLS